MTPELFIPAACDGDDLFFYFYIMKKTVHACARFFG
jgi:hypothetical protein